MKRHGNFDLLPKAEERTTLANAQTRFPSAFEEDDAPVGLSPECVVELETSTGAMTVYQNEEPGINWVYFPGEGWDGY